MARKMKVEALKADIEMSAEVIAEVLYNAYVTKLPVAIQAAILRNGLYYPDGIALALGFLHDRIILQVKKTDREQLSE